MIIPEDTHLRSVYICHRIPERTLKIGSWYMPVCARCTGLFVGAFLYYVYFFLIQIDYTFEIIIIGILASLPTFFDWLSQNLGYRVSTNPLRFFTGLLGGIGLGILATALMLIIIKGG